LLTYDLAEFCWRASFGSDAESGANFLDFSFLPAKLFLQSVRMGKKPRSKKKVPKTPPNNSPRVRQWKHLALFGAVCALIIGIYAWSGQPGTLESVSPRASDSYYNLLVEGFRAGQLSVNRPAPPSLAQLPDPYDTTANTTLVWDMHDLCYEMSYYQGKLYLYFGPAPALVLFWPCVALTGHYLTAKSAVVIFFAIGLIIAAGLMNALWRRYFPQTSAWLVVAGIVAMGLCIGTLEILSSCDVYEVAKSCGYAFVMLSLAGIWRALHDQKHETIWLSLASLACGLAVASRSSLLFGAVILLMPAACAWRERACAGAPEAWLRVALLTVAAIGPLMLIGLGMMIYNYRRFGSPWEFGWHYQLTDNNQHSAKQFGIHYLWYNFRFYFLEPLRWTASFPFLKSNTLPPPPAGYVGIGAPYSGILFDYPFVWLALAVPLAWKVDSAEKTRALRWFIAVLISLFAVCALTICLFLIGGSRYQFDFLPALMLLAVIGLFALEQKSAGLPKWRILARTGSCLLLAYTLVFNIFAAVEAHANNDFVTANYAFTSHEMDRAAEYFQKTVDLEPDSADARRGLGCALDEIGHASEAAEQLQKAVEIKPDYAQAYADLAACYLGMGRIDDALVQSRKALELTPASAVFHNTLGFCLLQKGSVDEAIAEYQQAVKYNSAYATAYYNLGDALRQQGRLDEAILAYQKATKVQPDYAAAYNNLAFTFLLKRMAAQAVTSYQKTLELQPQFLAAQINLAWILATWPDASIRNGQKALALAEEANQLSGGNDPQVLHVLAAAYAEAGDFPKAVSTANQALALAQGNTAFMQKIQTELDLYSKNTPCHSGIN
jgi:tetratricopeptide (TPR) repeat protein